MSGSAPSGEPDLRYQPDEKPPPGLSLGVGLQLAVLNIAAVMLIPMVVMRAAGVPPADLSWAVLASAAICGVATILQALRARRIGMGHVLVMGTSGAFIPASIATLQQGGPALLATLVAASALVPLLLSWRLSLFQRVLTPTVSGTVIMLIPITVLPFVSGLLGSPEAFPETGAAAGVAPSFIATVLVIGGLALRAKGRLRLWAPVIGVVLGSIIGAGYGLYDHERVAAAPWLALPGVRPPGFDLEFGPAFWTLLPGFLLVALIAAVRTMSSAVAVQRVSWRGGRAVDFRAVQGAMAVDGVGNLLAGLAGTVPGSATTTSVPLTQLTGVAARTVGIVAGAGFIAFALLPKPFAAVLAVPDPVFAGYLVVLLAMLFVIGMRMVMQSGPGHREALVAGIAFLVGAGFQYGLIFPLETSQFAGGLLTNGMTAGGFSAILMTLALRATEPRPRRMQTEFDQARLPRIQTFLAGFATRNGWDDTMSQRLGAVAEEVLLALAQDEDGTGQAAGRAGRRAGPRRKQKPDQGEDDRPDLLLSARRDGGDAVLEFAVGPGSENLQDRIAWLGEPSGEAAVEREAALRLLRHLASSVRHRQYHDTEIVTVRVASPGSG